MITKKQDFISLCGGSTFLEIGKTQLSAFQIGLPSTRTEQAAIAEVLSDMDALLEALDRLIAKKSAIKQGAMQALLTGRVRLPGFERQPGHKRTEVGAIPEDWEVRRLGDIARYYSGGIPSTSISEYYGGDIDWITSSDLNKGHISEVDGKITKKLR